ncbi:MAG: hypothetical protein K0Q47_1674 [Sedimentibacter sp.]|nr:hypothetical protein [Sedimentibacter sp.]
MKLKIQKSNYGIKLDNPSLIESKTSLVMQFLFYFLFLIIGISGVYGCFYTTFSLPVMLHVFIPYAVVFCAVFTILFLVKASRIFLLSISLSAAAYVLFIKQGIDVLINHLTQGYFITYNSVISAYASKIQSSLFTFPTVHAGSTEISAYSTMFAIFTLFFFTLLMAWILIRRKNTLLCFILTAPFLVVSVVFGIIPNYAAVGALYLFWAFLILNSTFLRRKSKFNKKKGVFYSGGKNEINPQSLILLPYFQLITLSAPTL